MNNDEVSILKSIGSHLVENQHILNEINHNLCNAVKAQAIGDDIAIEPRFFKYMSQRDFDFDLSYLQALRNGYTQHR